MDDHHPPAGTPTPSALAPPPRLLAQFRQAARSAGHVGTRVASFAAWADRYIVLHDKRHPG
jgi:hypothetical protein